MTIKSTNHLTHITTFYVLLYSNNALCAEFVEYDHTFLMGKNALNIDFSRYTEGNPTLSGIYDAGVYVNDQLIMSQSITFVVIRGKENAQICVTQKSLLQFHISPPDKSSEKAALLKRNENLDDCPNLAGTVLQSSICYDVNDQRLDADVPQA